MLVPATRLPPALVLAAALVPLSTASAAPGATVSADRQVVTVPDRTGDVDRAHDARKAVETASDLSAVRYTVDRGDVPQLTVTYHVTKVLKRSKRHHQVFLVRLVGQQGGVASTAFGKVKVYDGTSERARACEDAFVAVDRRHRRVAQVVPLDCLGADVEDGRARAYAGVERAGGADLGWDRTRASKKLHLAPRG